MAPLAQVYNFFFLVYVFQTTSSPVAAATDCPTGYVRSMPKDHLFSRQQKPVVIGHRGNPTVFQENTLEGFTSLLEIGADGFELDIYLTKDEQLAVYHDDTTVKLTDGNLTMWDSTYEELQKLNINRFIKYGNRTWDYKKTRKIPLLKDILEATKDKGMYMYLEIKPSYTRDYTESDKVGRAVAKMVTDMKLEKQASIISFDPFKSLAARKENPNIPVGFFYKRNWWMPQIANELKQKFGNLPGMKTCVDSAPNGTDFTRAMFQSGAVPKAINASFLDMDYKIYDNPLFSNNTFQTLRTNYSPNISVGAWTIYKITDYYLWDTIDGVVDRLTSQGAQRLITDNVPRVLKQLGRSVNPKTTEKPVGSAGRLSSSGTLAFIMFMSAVICFWVSN